MALHPATDQFSQFLRLAFFRSPNYVKGVSGWSVEQDGSAEFNNVTIRGNLVIGTNSQGVFIYNGAPALGNPPVFVAVVPGTTTDPFGNSLPLVGTANPVVDIGNLAAGGAHLGIDASGDLVAHAASGAEIWLLPGFPAELVYDVNGVLRNSIATAPAADGAGNAILAGHVTYSNQFPSPWVAAALIDTGVTFSTAPAKATPPQGGPWTLAGYVLWDVANNRISILGNVRIANALTVATGLLTAGAGLSVTGGETADSIAVSGVGAGIFKVTETGGAPAQPPTEFEGKTAGDRCIAIRVTGDANHRLRIDDTGVFLWGAGALGGDTNLYRASAGVLATDNSFRPATMASLATQTQQNFTAERVIGTYTIPAGDAIAGSAYTFWGAGVAGDVLTPTLQIRVRVGGLTGAIIGDTTGITCRTAAGMAFSWSGRLVFTTAGAASVLDADCNVTEHFASGAGAIHGHAAQGTAGPDTTAAVTVVVTAAWSAASASNTIQTSSGSMERINH